MKLIATCAAAVAVVLSMAAAPSASAMTLNTDQNYTADITSAFAPAQMRAVHYCNGTAETTIIYDGDGRAVSSSWQAVGVDCV